MKEHHFFLQKDRVKDSQGADTEEVRIGDQGSQEGRQVVRRPGYCKDSHQTKTARRPGYSSDQEARKSETRTVRIPRQSGGQYIQEDRTLLRPGGWCSQETQTVRRPIHPGQSTHQTRRLV